MLSEDKNVSFRCIFWSKDIFFRQYDTCPFLVKGEFVYKNPLRRSVLKSQSQNPRNLDDFFTRFTQKQLPIHDGTKNRLNTLSHRLLGESLEVHNKKTQSLSCFVLIT